MKLYISGPMTGKPRFNIPALDKTAELLRDMGHEVISPAELDNKEFRDVCIKCETGTIKELEERCIQEDVPFLSVGKLLERDIKIIIDKQVEGIVALSGWKTSTGAKLEVFTAKLFNLPIYIINISETGLIELIDGEVNDILFPRELKPNPYLDPKLKAESEALLDTAESVQADKETISTVNVEVDKRGIIHKKEYDERTGKELPKVPEAPTKGDRRYQCGCLEFGEKGLCKHHPEYDPKKYKSVYHQLIAEGKEVPLELPDGPIKRALPLVHGARQATYGHPSEDFARTAGIWSSLFGWDVRTEDVPLAMVAVKMSRLMQTPGHEDSVTDLVGYAECYSMTQERNWPTDD